MSASPNVSSMVEIRPATAARRADVADLFAANGTVAGCGCMYFILRSPEFNAGWSGGNRERLLRMVAREDPPMGLLAYRDGRPVGWCATGPRSRYAKVAHMRVYKDRDPAEDDAVWLISCLFVRPGERGGGVAAHLLEAAVRLAEEYGAPAVEAFPYAGGERRSGVDAFIGTEPMFARLGFTVRARPTPKRVIMRLDLPHQPASEE
jgi:GNAT superfamily N-acetyltransferase